MVIRPVSTRLVLNLHQKIRFPVQTMYNVVSKPVTEQELFNSFPVLFVCEVIVNCSNEPTDRRFLRRILRSCIVFFDLKRKNIDMHGL